MKIYKRFDNNIDIVLTPNIEYIPFEDMINKGKKTPIIDYYKWKCNIDIISKRKERFKIISRRFIIIDSMNLSQVIDDNSINSTIEIFEYNKTYSYIEYLNSYRPPCKVGGLYECITDNNDKFIVKMPSFYLTIE